MYGHDDTTVSTYVDVNKLHPVQGMADTMYTRSAQYPDVGQSCLVCNGTKSFSRSFAVWFCSCSRGWERYLLVSASIPYPRGLDPLGTRLRSGRKVDLLITSREQRMITYTNISTECLDKLVSSRHVEKGTVLLSFRDFFILDLVKSENMQIQFFNDQIIIDMFS